MPAGSQLGLRQPCGSGTHPGSFQEPIVGFGVSGDLEVALRVPALDAIDGVPSRRAWQVLVCHMQPGHQHSHLVLIHRLFVLQVGTGTVTCVAPQVGTRAAMPGEGGGWGWVLPWWG